MRGKLCFSVAGAEPQRDHPRGCGENKTNITQLVHYLGSPPRMRGKQGEKAVSKFPIWITPADAGKTRNRACAARQARDHPRGCGENNGAISDTPSSRRITPADAGKTSQFLR